MNYFLLKFNHKLFFIFIIVVLPFYSSFTYARDYIEDETISPESIEDIKDPIEYGLESKERKFPPLRNFIKGLPQLLQDSTLTPHFRSYSFSRTTQDDTDPDALTVGGEIRFLSGMLKETFQVGASYYISHGIHDNDGEDTLLLGANGSDLNTLGQLYLQAAIKDAYLRLYRQSFSLPYVNKQDSRMIPNTHEAYIIERDGATIDFIGGHVSQIKTRNSEGFTSMAEAAGANGSGKGLHMLGARYKFNEYSNIGAINYYTEDVLNIFYSEFNYTKIFTDEISTKFSGQYTHQSSVGDELIGDFDTHHIGIQLQASYRNAIVTVAGSNTGSDAAIQSPFGGRPGYLSLMILDFDRADEMGILTGLSYDFSNWGLPSLSGFAKFAWGHNAEDASTGQSLPDASEYNVTLDFKPTSGLLNGAWLRLRHARADYDGGDFIEDTRIILNYELPFY